MARKRNDPVGGPMHKTLTPPGLFLVRMLVFLTLVAFLVAILHEQLTVSLMTNPGLNGLIIGVLALGIIYAFRQVIRLYPEIRFVNAFRISDPGIAGSHQPVLLAPMATMLRDRTGALSLSTVSMRTIMDSIGSRLDEARDTGRYMVGLLVFLGLLGTFWGLLETIQSVGGVIGTLNTGGGESVAVFDELKAGLAAPLKGMGTAFSSSLLGLSGSLVLGFLDLQSSQAQNRFYTELEDWLSTTVYDQAAEPAVAAGMGGEVRSAIERLREAVDQAGAGKSASAAMANLAEAIQGLVHHMRTEQQMIRDWVDSQADQQREIKKLLEVMVRENVNR